MRKKLPINSPLSLPLFVLIVYIVFLLLRIPQIIWPGRFWAEEGSVYFREAYTHTPWEVITTANLGYYSLLNKIASIAAVHAVPLQFAPIVTMLFALAVQILPVWLLLFSHVPSLAPWLYKIAAIGLVLFIQPNQEVWLNTVNSQFFLCISTAIILISEPTNRLAHVFRLGILALAGLTGVVSCLLLPLFWIEYAWLRNRLKFYEALVMTLVSAIQGFIVAINPGRDTYLDLNLLAFVLVTKQWAIPVLGGSAAESFSDFVKHYKLFNIAVFALAALLPYVALAVGLVLWGNRRSWLLFSASVSIASVSMLMSVEAHSADVLMAHLSAFGGGRYYYAPNVLLALALAIPLRQSGFPSSRYSLGFRMVCVALVGFMLTVGAYDFINSRQLHKWTFDGPSWPVEVRNWQENGLATLHIWPRPWSMNLPKSEIVVEQEASPDAKKPNR